MDLIHLHSNTAFTIDLLNQIFTHVAALAVWFGIWFVKVFFALYIYDRIFSEYWSDLTQVVDHGLTKEVTNSQALKDSNDAKIESLVKAANDSIKASQAYRAMIAEQLAAIEAARNLSYKA